MIVNYKGQNMQGSSALQTSVADEEVIPNGNRYVNFALLNDQDAYVYINGSSDVIFIRANQGITSDFISSLKFNADGVTFNWIGVKA